MFLTTLFAATPDNPRFSLNDPAAWESLFQERTSSGVVVSRELALTYAPWWRGICLLSAGVGMLPCDIYQRTGKGPGAKSAVYDDHPAQTLIRWQSATYQGAFTFKELLTAHALQTGNGYAYIDRDGAGQPKELIPMDPEHVIPAKEDGKLIYILVLGARSGRFLLTMCCISKAWGTTDSLATACTRRPGNQLALAWQRASTAACFSGTPRGRP